MSSYQAKVVVLISGGLDSMLAAQMMLDQGLHVEGLNFFTGFCVEGHTHAIRKKNGEKRNNALWVAEQLGIKLHIVDVVEPYKDVVINPKYGYGANLNPCLDCKIFMVNRAKQWMEENHFDFIATGEVIGQRPKSQKKQFMPLVANQSGAFDRLLRPLSAQFLPPTLPEIKGWVDRKQLKALHGRGRTPQMQMAAEKGLTDYATPAGGCCFLTDKNYTTKLQDLWQNRGDKRYELDDIMLLKVGRHLRPQANFKIIIGREEGENNFLEGYRKQFIAIRSTSHLGPLSLVDGHPTEDDLLLATKLAARFGKGRDENAVQMQITFPDGSFKKLTVKPMATEDIPQGWYL